MSEVVLGKLVSSQQKRDAIHIAVIPMKASEDLNPGQKVGIISETIAGPSEEPVGIVDPFLLETVLKDSVFWLCLFPNTVTGMRHAWENPAFTWDTVLGPSKLQSGVWLRKFVKESNCPDYDTVISAASGKDITCVNEDYYGTYEIDDEYLFFSGRDAHGDIPDEFWDHVENVTGKKCEYKPKYFSCSC